MLLDKRRRLTGLTEQGLGALVSQVHEADTGPLAKGIETTLVRRGCLRPVGAHSDRMP